ncbi:hypothetical protein ACFX13_014250 [Malus domestica]
MPTEVSKSCPNSTLASAKTFRMLSSVRSRGCEGLIVVAADIVGNFLPVLVPYVGENVEILNPLCVVVVCCFQDLGLGDLMISNGKG